MYKNIIYPLALAFATALPGTAATVMDWDVGVGLTTHFKEVEVGLFPRGWDGENLCGPLRLGVGLVVPQGDHPEGVRLHLDSIGATRGPFFQAGLILSGGQDLGAGLGARLGMGYRWRENFRVTLLVDGVAGSHKSEGSVGIQAAYTF